MNIGELIKTKRPIMRARALKIDFEILSVNESTGCFLHVKIQTQIINLCR